MLFLRKCTILNEHQCRCEKKVDVADSKSAGASLSAACGGVKRRRSRCSGRRATKAFAPRRSSGTANEGDIRRRKAATIKSQRRLVTENEIHTCRCDEMVDVADSKSAAGDSVPVRVRSPAPKKQIPIRVSAFLHVEGDELEPIKCNSPVDCCARRLDGAQP